MPFQTHSGSLQHIEVGLEVSQLESKVFLGKVF